MSMFSTTEPQENDTQNDLLGKILQVLNGGGSPGGGGGVTSVNGDTGPAVTLDSSDIAEGSSLYFTEARVRATPLTGYSAAVGTISAADSVLSAFNKLGAVVNNGRVLIGNGTAGAPSLAFLSDDDGTGTGIFRSAANVFGISTDGVQRVWVLADGKVGLTITPTHDFQVGSNSTSNSKVCVMGGDLRIGNFAGNGVAYLQARDDSGSANLNLQLRTQLAGSAVNVLCATGAKLLGIGPSLTPSANLDVNNSTTAVKAYFYERTDSAASPVDYSRLVLQPQAGNHLIRTEAAGTDSLRTLQVGTGPVAADNAAGVSTIIHGGQSRGSGAGGSILFQVSAAGGAGSTLNALGTAMTLEAGGNLGLGAAPSATTRFTVSTTSAVAFEAASVNANTAITNISSFVLTNTDATTNNWAGMLFADAVGGAGAGTMGVQIKDHTNNYGDFAVGTRDTDGFLERFRIRGVLTTYGGITSSFPALKRSSAQLHCRLADDSADAVFQALQFNVAGTKVVGAQGAAVADASGGSTIDAEARTALNALLARLRTHGLIAT